MSSRPPWRPLANTTLLTRSLHAHCSAGPYTRPAFGEGSHAPALRAAAATKTMSAIWTHRHGPCCSEAVPGLRRVQQARVTARWQTLRAKLIKALARKSAESCLKLHQEQLAVQCCMQTRRPPRLVSRVLPSCSAFGCFRHRLLAAATAYSEQLPVINWCCATRAGARLPSARSTLSTWEARPACMLIAARSVQERSTTHAARRRQERGARTSPL